MSLNKALTENYYSDDGEFETLDMLLTDLELMIDVLKRMRYEDLRRLGRAYYVINVDVEILPEEVANDDKV